MEWRRGVVFVCLCVCVFVCLYRAQFHLRYGFDPPFPLRNPSSPYLSVSPGVGQEGLEAIHTKYAFELFARHDYRYVRRIGAATCVDGSAGCWLVGLLASWLAG